MRPQLLPWLTPFVAADRPPCYIPQSKRAVMSAMQGEWRCQDEVTGLWLPHPRSWQSLVITSDGHHINDDAPAMTNARAFVAQLWFGRMASAKPPLYVGQVIPSTRLSGVSGLYFILAASVLNEHVRVIWDEGPGAEIMRAVRVLSVLVHGWGAHISDDPYLRAAKVYAAYHDATANAKTLAYYARLLKQVHSKMGDMPAEKFVYLLRSGLERNEALPRLAPGPLVDVFAQRLTALDKAETSRSDTLFALK